MRSISLFLLVVASASMVTVESRWANTVPRSGTVMDLASIYEKATRHYPFATVNKRRHHLSRLHDDSAKFWQSPSTEKPQESTVASSTARPSVPGGSTDARAEDPYSQHHRNNKQETSVGPPSQQQTSTPHPHTGRHVCTHEETVTRPIRVVESYCKPAYKSFTQRCSNGTMCTAFRVQYDTIYRTVVKYQTTTEKKHVCCPGWTHTAKHTHGCLQAVCSKGCKNGGTCVKPNICNCAPGYTGPSCESDLDECTVGNRCQQICINSAGSYQCACHEGFQLQEDGRTCKFRLELVPELQTLLTNYESMSKRLAALEQEPRDSSQPAVHPVDIVDYQSTISNMTQHILSLEDKLSKLQTETATLIANSNNGIESRESSNSDSLASLSEQVAILEERLADCTCTSTPVDNKVKARL